MVPSYGKVIEDIAAPELLVGATKRDAMRDAQEHSPAFHSRVPYDAQICAVMKRKLAQKKSLRPPTADRRKSPQHNFSRRWLLPIVRPHRHQSAFQLGPTMVVNYCTLSELSHPTIWFTQSGQEQKKKRFGSAASDMLHETLLHRVAPDYQKDNL